jgi:hypothetical protein
LEVTASTIGTFSADDIADLKAQREAILMQDPNTPLTQLPTSVNGRKMNVEDDDYKTLLREERRDFGWATSPSQLRDHHKRTLSSAITGQRTTLVPLVLMLVSMAQLLRMTYAQKLLLYGVRLSMT